LIFVEVDAVRDEIKKIAVDLLITNGYAGFRYADIASALKITRTNIHYHFGNKQKLCELVILEEIAVGIATYSQLLTDPKTTIREKISAVSRINKDRYLAYNPTGQTNNPWALVSRMRLESQTLTRDCRKALILFRENLEESIGEALDLAIRKGELRKDTPVRELSLIFVAIINSSDPTTRDTQSFTRVEELYEAFMTIVEQSSEAKVPAPGGGARAAGSNRSKLDSRRLTAL
jgi:TetR/AcrR family transcriptional regulator, transcriptional repressor for nem operon